MPRYKDPCKVSLQQLYRRLFRAFGPQRWWPATSSFEVMVGAILTQATNWRNVEVAITRLKQAGFLSPRKLVTIPSQRLEAFITPAGYFRQKARRLREFSAWYLKRWGGNARRLFKTPWRALREQLLELNGIGPETADSILLYAGNQPVFVVDAYTTRVFYRHGLIDGRASYEEIQRFAMKRLPRNASLYNEFHALLVAVGKQYCHRRDPDCAHCPLGDLPRIREVKRYGLS